MTLLETTGTDKFIIESLDPVHQGALHQIEKIHIYQNLGVWFFYLLFRIRTSIMDLMKWYRSGTVIHGTICHGAARTLFIWYVLEGADLIYRRENMFLRVSLHVSIFWLFFISKITIPYNGTFSWLYLYTARKWIMAQKYGKKSTVVDFVDLVF